MHPVRQFTPQDRPAGGPRLGLRYLLRACVLTILFSSTMFAGRAGEYVYHRFLSGLVAFEVAQKSLHVTLFAVFGGICYQVLAPRSRGARFALAMLASLIMGAGSETVQIFTHRDPSIADVLLNLASGTLGALVAWALEKGGTARATEVSPSRLLAKQ